MRHELINMLATVGAFFLLITIGMLIHEGFYHFSEWLRYRKRRYHAEHFTDKKPIAKCYCASCRDWMQFDSDPTSGRCIHSNYHTANYEFCSRGMPKETSDYTIYKEFDSNA